MHGDMTIGS